MHKSSIFWRVGKVSNLLPTQKSLQELRLPPHTSFTHLLHLVTPVTASPCCSALLFCPELHTPPASSCQLSPAASLWSILSKCLSISPSHIKSPPSSLKRAASYFTQNSGNLQTQKSRLCCQETDFVIPQLLTYLSFHFFVFLHWFTLFCTSFAEEESQNG